jgi:hypothetical protein
MYGMKSLKTLTPQEIQKTARSYGIDSGNLFFLQKSYTGYFDSLGSIYGFNIHTCDTVELAKNHFQPLQILFFDKSGQLVSFHNNCYCGGFPNLKWNRNNILDTLPAKQVVQVDTLLSFPRMIGFLRDVNNKIPEPLEFTDKDYSIVVFWTTFMGRQSRRLIKIVNKKYRDTGKENVGILYVNADYLFDLE